MRKLGLISAALSLCIVAQSAMASDSAWAEKSFHADTDEYAYTVGVGVGNDELAAIREANQHAMSTFIQTHFSRSAKISVKTVDGTSGVVVDERMAAEVNELDLTQFEKIDQSVSKQDFPGRLYTVKSLYRYPKSEIRKNRESQPNAVFTNVDDAALTKKIAEARQASDERERVRIEGEAVYDSTYPLLGLDFTLGYLKVANYSFLSAGFGLPMRLGLISDRLVLRPFFLYGFGGTNTVASEASNDTDNPKYTTALSLGIDARLFITQSTNFGLYLIAQASQDRVAPTCPKTNAGNCTTRAEAPFTQTSYSGGVGFVIPSRHPLGVELLYGVPDHRVGIQFQMGLPLLK